MPYLSLQRLTINTFQSSKGSRNILKAFPSYVESIKFHRTFWGTHPKSFASCHVFTFGLPTSKARYFATEVPQLPKKKEFAKRLGPITWRNLLITLGIGSALTIGMQIAKKDKQEKLEKQRTRELGKAAIGGKFELVDHNGKPCSSDDLLGQWLMIYFGFTHCPDICPEEIEKMMEVVEIIDKNPKIPNILPLMITVDAERDNVDVLAKYVKEFSPKLIGLTGSKEQVHKTTRAYRVYYSEGPKDEDNDYIVDHTIIIYLINPEGEFVDYYGQTKSADQISNAILLQMAKFKKEHSKSWLG